MKNLFNEVSFETSKLTTRKYSTSFSLGIRFFHKELQNPIYGIYGYVRFADEIVDTFHNHDKVALFNKFKSDTYDAIENKISMNPILQSFQLVVNQYKIEHELIDTFLNSMEMDLYNESYDSVGYKKYITGSAEVVGLMCLRVYCKGNEELFQELRNHAISLGSAYQKINFLRDLSSDYHQLGRVYFPNVAIQEFNDTRKQEIIEDIEKDFLHGFLGILKLPKECRFGVYLSYVYFHTLLQKIKFIPSSIILRDRVRLGNLYKLMLLSKSYVKNKLNLIGWQN